MFKNFNKLLFVVYVFLFTLLLSSCQTLAKNSYSENYYITVINLNDYDIKSCCDTDNFFYIDEFAKSQKCDIAFNTTPFSYDSKGNAFLLGFYKNNQEILSQAYSRYSALAFTTDNSETKACIIKNQENSDSEKFNYIFGGFFTILEDSKILEYEKQRRSRTACGITKNKDELIILSVISTRLDDKSGMTYEECGEILKELGCTDAIEFDGGHSTALYNSELRPSYIHAKKVRKVPAALGFSRKRY